MAGLRPFSVTGSKFPDEIGMQGYLSFVGLLCKLLGNPSVFAFWAGDYGTAPVHRHISIGGLSLGIF